MGRVYKAVQRKLNRPVAIKTLLPQFAADPQVARRFEREATTIAALVHPNVVSVFDVGTNGDGFPYFVMEYVDGRSLRHILRDEAPLSCARAVRLVDQVLFGLAEAHTRGIIHRDLKPANVMVVALQDGQEVCKVLDFGIAKSMDERSDEGLTRVGESLGTPGYMAPERVASDPYDHRIDLYAAGVMLYELITGQRVYKAASEGELLKMTLGEAPDPPSTRTTRQIPTALDGVCLKALARAPKDRFATAAEFREALANALRTSTPLGSGSFTIPLTEYTSLAMAVDAQQSATPSRTVLSALLSATQGWEHTHLLERFEAALTGELASGQFEAVTVTITSLQQELRHRGPGETLKVLVDSVRGVIATSTQALFGWLASESLRPNAQWLLRLLGKDAVVGLLQGIASLEPAVQPHLFEVVRSLDPDGKLTLAALRLITPAQTKAALIAARQGPDELSAMLFLSTLQAADARHRQAALEALDERTAFRCGLTVRQRLHDPVPGVRAEALRWVVRLDDESAVTDLLKLLERASLTAAERHAVWRVLGHFNSSMAVGALLEIIKTVHDVQEYAELARLLVRSGSTRAISELRWLSASLDGNLKVKRVVDEALREARV